jgi:proteic killer suppression protein
MLHCTLNRGTMDLDKEFEVLAIFNVIITKQARGDLARVPIHIVRKLQSWVDDVEYHGLNEVRKVPGFHDEPLRGKRSGQRSIRLSRAYRAIYVIDRDGKIEVVKVVEINKHDY